MIRTYFRAMRSFWLLIFGLVVIFSPNCVSSAENSTDNGICSNKCSVDDDSLSCWNTTQSYYDKNFVNAVNDWQIVQLQIDEWHRRHSGFPTDTNETTVDRLSRDLPSNSILDTAHLKEIVPILFEMISSRAASLPDSLIGMPEFVCPIPCGYESQLWKYLFIASVLVNVAMLLVVIPFIIKSERRDKKLYAKQVSMMQMLKPPSKSRNPSSS